MSTAPSGPSADSRAGRLARWLPFLAWPRLTAKSLRADLVAGITVSLVAIPQSLAYAQLSGVPPLYGLYAAFIPSIVGVLFGSSAILSTGPVAMTSLLTAASVGALVAPATDAFYAYVTMLALLSGLFQLGLGLARVGVLLSLVSQPVLMGFVNAAALIIALSQLPALMGISVRQSHHLLLDTWNVVSRPDLLHEMSLAFGLAAIVLLVAFRRLAPRLPGVLITVALATWVSHAAGFAERGGRVVGEIPSGLPSLAVPALELGRDPRAPAGRIRPRADQLHGGDVELQGHRDPPAHALGREPGAHRAGPREDRGGAVPVDARERIVFPLGPEPRHRRRDRAVVGVRRGRGGRDAALLHALPARPAEAGARGDDHAGGPQPDRPAGACARPGSRAATTALAATATFVTTLAFAPNIQNGILTGILLSLAAFLYRRMRPRIALVGLHEDGTLRDAERFDLPHLHARIGALRFDASLYFANAAYFEEAVLKLERDRPDIAYIMVAAHSINDIDATGVETLRNLAQRLRQSGVTLVLSGIKSNVLEILERTGAVEVLGRDNLYGSDNAAIADLRARLGQAEAAPR